MSENTAKQKRAEIEKNLFASQQVLVLEAIKEARDLGDAALIEPLLVLMKDTDDTQVRTAVHAMLSELKITAAERALMDAAVQDRFAPIRTEILSFVWSSGLQPVEDLEPLCRMALEGDYPLLVEVYTILDNMEGPYREEHVLEAELLLREWVADPKNEGNERFDLVQTLRKQLANMHHNLID
jgi:hypothetical protein